MSGNGKTPDPDPQEPPDPVKPSDNGHQDKDIGGPPIKDPPPPGHPG
ncbi:hypothetical protein [Streptomyces sp. NPDC050485]